jgi:hypothetical protein
MKFCELKHGKAMVWPPQRIGSAGPGDPSVEDGVLEGVERLGRRLVLRINIQGHRCTAHLEWQPPPVVGDVEFVLLASIGVRIRDLGGRELPTRSRPTH